ncbi:MAG: hypothetical protein ACYTFW_12550 [Planctomycetota bacterium]
MDILHGGTDRVTVRTPDQGYIETWFGNFTTSGTDVSLTFVSEHEEIQVASGSNVQFAANVSYPEEYDINFHNPEPEGIVQVNYSIWAFITSEPLEMTPVHFDFTDGPTLTDLGVDVKITFSVNIAGSDFVVIDNGTTVASGHLVQKDNIEISWTKGDGQRTVELNVTLNSAAYPGQHPSIEWSTTYSSAGPGLLSLLEWDFSWNATHAVYAGKTNIHPCEITVYEESDIRTYTVTTDAGQGEGLFRAVWEVRAAVGVRVTGQVFIVKDADQIVKDFAYVVPYSPVTSPTTTTTTTTTFVINWEDWGPPMAVGAVLLVAFMLMTYLFVLNEKRKIQIKDKKKRLSTTQAIKKNFKQWRKKYKKRLLKPPKGEKELSRRVLADRIIFEVVLSPWRGLKKLGGALRGGASSARERGGQYREKREQKDWWFLPDEVEED